MINYDLLKGKPFHLDDEQLQWVKDTLASMSEADKIGHLFCLSMREGTQEEIDRIQKVCAPGGVMYRPCTVLTAVNTARLLRENFRIPMLIAANLEKGGNGMVTSGTMLGSPTEIAATDDAEFARRLGIICGRESSAVGGNWAFAPIIDIDYNFRNPITNTRTFGSDPRRVCEFGREYVKEIQSLGVSACIKHFPGDGCDERDQHLVTSINHLSCEEWDKTYGRAYRESIDAGAMSVMIGHIMQPAYEKALNPSLRDQDIMPATLSPELMKGLLREKIGFNGLIVTDACTMAGFTIPMERKRAVPYTIASGADMFLFARNLEEDYAYMHHGVQEGVITQERLDEAVLRILGLKAALRLYKRDLPTLKYAESVVGCWEHKQWAVECAKKAVTLVKEETGVLPLTPDRYPNILYMPIESEQGVGYSVKTGTCDHFRELLENEGFHVDVFSAKMIHEGGVSKTTEITDHYDAIVYLANIGTRSNQTTVRIEWETPMGANCPHFIQTVPTIFISVENPYHLLDVPRIKTFINGYSSTEETLHAIIDKLLGRDTFTGKAPHDPFCGVWDTRL
jgi:beta-N-acetylhexosaminidase